MALGKRGMVLEKKGILLTISFLKGSVSGSGTGPGDRGSQGPAMPDPETFPYE